MFRFRLKRRSLWKYFVISTCCFLILTGFLNNTFHESGHVDEIQEAKKGPRPALKMNDSTTEESEAGGNDKWIVVVTSKLYPTAEIMKLSQLPGWKLLVVADGQKAPSGWALRNVTFLDIESQETLGYSILKLLPWNSYTRKAVGYLYAIENGAKFIFDTDEDKAPKDLLTFAISKYSRGLVTGGTSSNISNPYAHFGQATVWPRGYPLDEITKAFNKTYRVCQMPSPLIQQGLVNGNPDVDTIFRLTRKLGPRLNIRFDGSAPPVVYPPPVLSPFNSQNTLFLYEAFWSLLLPSSVPFRVTDIWRGYWAQPLLWLVGGRLGFYPPHSSQVRNARVYLKDFEGEDQLYQRSGDLVRLLTKWKCSKRTLYPCMLELTEVMASQDFWKYSEMDLMRAWISDLKKVGYLAPAFRKRSSCLPNKDEATAVFHGVKMDARNTRRSSILRRFCNSSFPSTGANSIPKFPSTLLVITFKFQHFENIWLLDLIYRPYYPNIVYCGELKNAFFLNYIQASSRFTKAGVKDFTFVRAKHLKDGYLIYECALRVIDMKYSVSGYLLVSDDLALNFWNNARLDPNEVWIANHILYRNLDVNLSLHIQGVAEWTQWSAHNESMWRGLTAIRESENPLIQKYSEDRVSFGLNTSMIGQGQGDLLYLPVKKQEVFYEVATVLWKAEVFLEMATPLLADGLSRPEDIIHLYGGSLWSSSMRSRPFDYFNSSESFLHPVKLSQVMVNDSLRFDYCKNYISRIV